jgi:IS605 OrfB family transposase
MSLYSLDALSEKLTNSNLAVAALETSQVVSSKHAATASFGVVTYKVKIPSEHSPTLDTLSKNAAAVVSRMLSNRGDTSSKFYKEVPCVIAKSLSVKYQRDLKCKSVTRICIPICGDKGKQVKLVEGGLRVPALFKKEVIACQFPLPALGFIRCVEFFKRNGKWFMSYTYNTPCAAPIVPVGVVGVDRNSVGNVATMASTSSGKVRMLGFNADRWKYNFRRRKARVMSQGRKRLASRLRRKQSCRTKQENHRIAKGIVAFAASQNCALSLENLKLTKGAKRYADKRQWAHAQLLGFIQYKAALRGVPVVFCDPAYTSQDCSRCGQRNKPDGKNYVCEHCGSKYHRDVGAAFNIAARGAALIGIGEFQASSRRALLTTRNLGSGVDK